MLRCLVLSGLVWAGACASALLALAPGALAQSGPPAGLLEAAVANATRETLTPGQTASGSGFFVSREGIVLTGAHVVAGCKNINVRAGGGPQRSAVLIGMDASNDLALLRASAPSAAVLIVDNGMRQAQPGAAFQIFGFPLGAQGAAAPVREPARATRIVGGYAPMPLIELRATPRSGL